MLLSLLVLFLFFILLPLFVPNSWPHRHNICLVSISFFLTLLAFIYFPIFIWRPCDTRNFRLIWYPIYLFSQILGLEYNFENSEIARKTKKCIVIINHQSYFDAVVASLTGGFFERMAIIATNGVKYLGPMGISSKLAGLIFVERFKGGAGYPDLKKKVETHFSGDEMGTILIFPEGRIGQGIELLKFKPGAFRLAAALNVPILPLVVSKYDISPDETIFRRGKVLAQFLDPIYVKEEDVERLQIETRDLMQTKFDELNQRIKAETPKNI